MRHIHFARCTTKERFRLLAAGLVLSLCSIACGQDAGVTGEHEKNTATSSFPQRHHVPFLMSWPTGYAKNGEAGEFAEGGIHILPGVIDTLLGTRKVTDDTFDVPFDWVEQVLVLVLRGISREVWNELHQGERLTAVTTMMENRYRPEIRRMWTPVESPEGGEVFWLNIAADREATLGLSGSNQERLKTVAESREPLLVAILAQDGAAPFDNERSLEEVSEAITDFLRQWKASGRFDDMAVILTATHMVDAF